MTIVLWAPDPSSNDVKAVEAIEARLHGLIPELRKIKNVEEIATEISGKADGKIFVILVSPTLPAGGVDNIINISKRFRGMVFFILVSKEIWGSDYKRLISSGNVDWVVATGSLREIPEIISGQTVLSDKGGAASQVGKKPIVVSFLPCVGGVGNTTIALEVALHIKLAKTIRLGKICYIDFDFQTSHVCDYLDIEARLQIQEIFDRPERLDEQLLELFVSHHSSGLDIFATPRSKFDPCGVNVVALDALLERIVGRYDFIVLDLPVPWFSWTIPTLENSDAVILTGINTIPCLRQMRVTLDAVLGAKATSTKVAIAINRVTRGLFGGIERRGHVESVLAQQEVFYVHEDQYAVDRVNTGTPVALGGSSRHAEDFAKLASFCAALKQAASGEKAG